MVVLSGTYGRPGSPGQVRVSYMNGLYQGCEVSLTVGTPGKGGAGLPPTENSDGVQDPFAHRGGAGGGRENVPLIKALEGYTESCKGTECEPLCFTDPGAHKFNWSYNTATATVVEIDPGGGGGGGWGEILPGEDGEDGLLGATFVIPTYLPLQRESGQ